MNARGEYDVYRDLDRLIDEGAGLRDLFDAVRGVEHPGWAEMSDPVAVDLSADRRRFLSEHLHRFPEFLPVRLHELFDGLHVEHDDDYVLMLIAGLGTWSPADREPARMLRTFLLRHDQELREGVFWRIFEVEGGGEVSLANADKFSAQNQSWQGTVLALAGEGLLDRSRLLRSSLEALNRDFSAYRAGWFSRLYTALKPSPREAAENQDLLRLCLSSHVGATVSLAAKQLAAIHRSGLLETDDFVGAVAPGMTGTKAAVQSLLGILRSVHEDAEVETMTEALVDALGHPHPEVQRDAASMLLQRGREDLVRAQRDALAPAVVAEVIPGPDEPSRDAPGTERCDTERSPVRQLAPWNEDDAVHRFSLLLERPSDALELELALAWLAAAERPEEVLSPLASRVRTVDPDHDRYWVLALLRAVLGIDEEFFPRPHRHPDTRETGGEEVPCDSPRVELLPPAEDGTVLPNLLVRMREVVEIVRGRAPRRPLLATPTDSAGRVDPGTLLARLEADGNAPGAVRDADAGLREADLQQALLRVPAQQREQVRAAAGAAPVQRTAQVAVQWRRNVSEHTVRGRVETSIWWTVALRTEVPEPSPHHPGLVADTSQEEPQHRRTLNGAVIGALGIVDPDSTLPLLAGIRALHHAGDGEVEDTRHSLLLLEALTDHPGRWSVETAQLLALGMAGKDAALRAVAVELFAAAVPQRLSAGDTAEGFAACAPAVPLTRWASSLADAAALAPGSVRDLLTALLPRLERAQRGTGELAALLLDESLRSGAAVSDPALRTWLNEFSGSSAAAKTARNLLARSGSRDDAAPRSR